jgi:hypothetical protein
LCQGGIVSCDFRSSIQNETWIEVSSENDIGEKWDSFYSIYNFHFNIVCPKVRRNIVSTLKSPWINKDAVIARTKLKDLYNLYMQSKIQEHRDIYKAYKKEYNAILKTAKANYIQNIITRSNNTSKVLWEFVNKERGSPNNILTGNINLQVGNEIVTSPSRTCYIFNKTFIETVSKLMLDKKLPQTSNNIRNIKDSFVLLEITEMELIKSPEHEE